MPPVLVLLSLLVGALEVHAAPLDKGTRPEEMVTRCIVEVLSNALAKPNAPPIDPECKEILKKSSSTQHSLDETDEQKQYETRNIKDIDSLNKHQYESNEEVKQSHVLPGRENEEKWHHEEDTSKEKKDEEKKHVDDKEESTGHSKERDFVDDDDEDDGDDEERGDHKNHNEKEIEKKDKSHYDDSQEATHNIFDKTVHQTAKSVKEFSEEDEEPSRLEEITKRHPIILDSDKYHEAHSGEVSIEFDGDHKHQNEKEIEKKDKSHHDDLQQAKHNIFDKTVHQTAKSVNKFSEGDEAPSRLEEIMKRLSIILDSDKNHAANSGEVSIEFDGDHKNNNEKEIEKRYKSHHDDSQQAKHNIFDKTVHQTAKSVNEFSEGDEEPSHLEEIMERHPIILDTDKYHTADSAEVSIESDDKEEDRKISNNKRHDDFVQRFLDYEEKSSNQKEKMNHVPSDKDTFHYRGQENHLKNNYEKRPHYERESSEESREKRYHHQDSEEEKDHHDSNEESNERELIGQHYEDKKHHLEIKRWASEKTAQSNYEQSNEDSEESKEEIEKRHRDDRLGKQELYRKLKHHFQDSEEDGSNKQDKKQQDKRHYIGDEIVDEMKRYYPDLSYQQNMRHYNEKNTENSNYPGNDKYKRHHSEEETRSFVKHGIPDDPFRWKNRYFENDNSEEERKRSLQTKNLFPDYDDYDLWGKKQFLDEINNEYGDKKNPFKIPKFEEKRQYDRMDELAQLLNYKKKSVEFPDFYDSEEIKKRHYNERNRLRQRPLTEEDKELENLAIMDLELQKIAEKLSNNRQG